MALRDLRQAPELPAYNQARTDMDAFFAFATADPAEFRLLFSEDTSDSIAVTYRTRLVDELTLRIADMVRNSPHATVELAPGEADILASMIVGLAVQAARRACPQGTVGPAVAAATATRLTYAGLRDLGRAETAENDGDLHAGRAAHAKGD